MCAASSVFWVRMMSALRNASTSPAAMVSASLNMLETSGVPYELVSTDVSTCTSSRRAASAVPASLVNRMILGFGFNSSQLRIAFSWMTPI
jgi:hypothetical protein